MPLDGKMFWFAIPIFIGFVAVEMLTLRYFGRSGYSWRESLATIGVGVGHKVSGLVRFGALGAVSAWLWNYRLAEVPLDTVWGLSLLFVAVEFTYYWYHRFSHTVRWMWASHAVHHSPEELNVLASFRLSWTSMLSGDFLLFLPLIWIGFQPAAVVTALALNLIYQSWVHTELIPKLGFVDGVLNTPSNHRVHHASNEVYLDRNYGGVLIIFDRIFGSYVAEREDVPCRYGLVKPVGSANPLWIAFHEWIAMMRDVASSRTLGEAFGYLFGRPGWRPDVRAETPTITPPIPARRAGKRVRITAQLNDATTGGHLWADRYDRELTDIFEVQDDVTHRIVDALRVSLSPAEKARLSDTETSNIDAYDCVLRGREIMLGNEKNLETFEQAIEFFMKAVELDPNYSQAYACLGFAYMFDYQNRWTDDPDKSLPTAKEYARQKFCRSRSCWTTIRSWIAEWMDR